VETARALVGQIYEGQRIAVLALSDGLLDAERYGPRWYIEGDFQDAAAALRAGTGVNISGALSDRMGLRVGDTLRLEAPHEPMIREIVGVVRDYMSDRGTVILSRDLLAGYWGDTSVNRFNVNLASGVLPELVRTRIREHLGGRYRLKILSPSDVLKYQAEAIDRAFRFTDAIQLLIIIVTVAGIFDLLLAAIIERRREFALWRVIGADEPTVRRSVVIESATIGALGSLLGCIVGLVTAWIWVGVNFRYLLGYHLEFRLAGWHMTWYVVLAMTMTVVAGYAAARRATAEPILRGIQTE
jgi:putative ABC transport system permease protein